MLKRLVIFLSPPAFMALSIVLAFINGMIASFAFVLSIVLFIVVGQIGSNQRKEALRDRANTLIESLINYDKTLDRNSCLIDGTYKMAFGINKVNNIIYFIDSSKRIKSYSFKDVLEVHIVEDGESITKASRGSQIGGALIGGILAGGVGAVIGGLSGKKKNSTEVKSIGLNILVNDTDDPLKTILMFRSEIGLKTNSKTYIKNRNLTEKWYNLIKVLIRRADEQDNIESVK